MPNIIYPFKITGYGYYLPPCIQTSKELSKTINKSEEWIIKRTGVVSRHISDIDVDEMGAIAAKKAIGEKNKPDLIINASGVPKQTIPDTSTFIQQKLGYSGIPCFSIHSTCLSFLTALNIAGSFISSNLYKRILVVSSDRGTRGRNYNEPESAALLGDAAAALYIESTTENKGIINYTMQTWPEGATYTEVRGGGTNLHPQDDKTTVDDNLFSMNGPLVYKLARKKVYSMIQDDLKSNNLRVNDIDCVVPHQASKMAIQAYSKYGGFNSNKVIDILENTGNCVAASLPLSLTIALKDKKIKDDNLIYLVGTGAGLSIASILLKV